MFKFVWYLAVFFQHVSLKSQEGRVLIIGSGISGLVAASSLQHFGSLERMVQFTPLVFGVPVWPPLPDNDPT